MASKTMGDRLRTAACEWKRYERRGAPPGTVFAEKIQIPEASRILEVAAVRSWESGDEHWRGTSTAVHGAFCVESLNKCRNTLVMRGDL